MILAKNCVKFIALLLKKREKVKRTETNTVKNEETGEQRKSHCNQRSVLKHSLSGCNEATYARQIEEAELEFSVEMSNCIKKGILTKAMLAKKYSDTGGLLAEEDAKALTKMYVKYGELSQESEKIQIKSVQTEKMKLVSKKLLARLLF